METLTWNVYDAKCPTRHVLDLIADKWATLIIGLLNDEQPQRFAALQRQIGGISQKMLTQTLRSLERNGLVQRTVYPQVPPRVEYALTTLGQTLCEPIAALIRWSEENINAVTAAQQRYDQCIPGGDGPQ
jgi:DNA-binding HxlR family transcriptional regulator